jgi:hypothetical protein
MPGSILHAGYCKVPCKSEKKDSKEDALKNRIHDPEKD